MRTPFALDTVLAVGGAPLGAADALVGEHELQRLARAHVRPEGAALEEHPDLPPLRGDDELRSVRGELAEEPHFTLSRPREARDAGRGLHFVPMECPTCGDEFAAPTRRDGAALRPHSGTTAAATWHETGYFSSIRSPTPMGAQPRVTLAVE